jgi:hypothetical protein
MTFSYFIAFAIVLATLAYVESALGHLEPTRTEKLTLTSMKQARNRIFPEYGINFRHVGKINQNLNRMTVVTTIALPKVREMTKHRVIALKCNFLLKDQFPTKNQFQETELNTICRQLDPYIEHIRSKAYDHVHEINQIFVHDIHELLPELKSEVFRPKRAIGLIATAFAGLITLAVESLGSYLRNRQQKQMGTAVQALRGRTAELNTLTKDMNEDFLMYGKYTTDTVTNLVETITRMNNRVSVLENFFQGNNSEWTEIYRQGQINTGLFSLQLSLYLMQLQEEHDTNYQLLKRAGKELQVAIAKLVQGYLPIEIFPPSRLNEIIEDVRRTLKTTYVGYELALPGLSHMYDMKLVTFAVDQLEQRLVVSFPVFIREHTIRSMDLYEIETIHVPIEDRNKKADSYSKIEIEKTYIATNRDYYINIRISELLMCKQIRYDYYCEELFMVKHKTQPSCASAILYKQPHQNIIDNCDFKFFYNKTVPPVVLDGGPQILLANIPENGQIKCQQKTGLPNPLPPQIYTLVDRRILCSCDLEMDMTYLLRDLNSCFDNKTQIPTRYSINLAVYHMYKKYMPTKVNTLKPKMTFTLQQFPFKLKPAQKGQSNNINLDQYIKETSSILTRTSNRTIRLNEMLAEKVIIPTYHNNILSIAGTAVATLAIMILIVVIIKHIKLRQLVTITAPTMTALLPIARAATKGATRRATNLATHLATHHDNDHSNTVCSNATFSYVTTIITCIGLTFFLIKTIRKLQWLKGIRHENNCTLYLFIFTETRYIPLKIMKMSHHVSMYKKLGSILPTDITLTKSTLWDTISLTLEEYSLWRDKLEINIPKTLQIELHNKIRVRQILKQHSLQVDIMLKQGNTYWEITKKPIYTNPDTQE